MNDPRGANLVASITGQQFVNYLRDGKLPPGIVMPTNPSEPALEVNGAVDYGGWDIPEPCAAFGVIFHGHVDLANAMVKGTLDLSGCVFEDGLRLDDAEIGGSLRLAGITVESHSGPGSSKQSQLLSVVGAVIKGRVDLTDATIRGDIELRGASIDGFLDLTGVQAQQILLGGLNLKGDLKLGRRLDSDAQVSRVDEIKGWGIEVGGSIQLYELRDRIVESSSRSELKLDFRSARVQGSVSVIIWHAGVPRRKNDDVRRKRVDVPDLKSVDFSGARIDGDVSFLSCYILEYLDFSDTRIAGNVRIGIFKPPHVGYECVAARMKTLHLCRARIEGFLHVVGAAVDDTTDLNSLTCHGVIEFANDYATRVELGGSLNMDGVTCNSTIKMLGIIAAQSVSMFSVKTRNVKFCVAKKIRTDDRSSDSAPDADTIGVTDDRPASDNTFYPCQIGNLDIENAHIQGTLDLSHLQIFGTPRRGGIGLKVVDTRIDGNLELWSARAFCKESDGDLADDIVKPWEFSAAIAGDVVIQRSKISGDVVLTFAKVSRMIDLSDSSVGGDLKAASTLTHSALGESDQIHADMHGLDPLAGTYRAVCNQLKMRMLRCDNDIDLTGLTIVADSSDQRSDVGDLSAGYIEVKGDVKLYEKDTRQPREAYAMVPGKLVLSDSHITRLIVSAYGFPAYDNAPTPDATKPADAIGVARDHPVVGKLRHAIRQRMPAHWFPARDDAAPRDKVNGVTLVRATLGTLEIPEVGEPPRYPESIDLEDAEIGIWRIGQPDLSDANPRRTRLERLIDRMVYDSPERQVARRYIRLLANDTFHRSTYKAVEASLRNSGDDIPADIVYREMHRRAHRESGSWSLLFVLWGLLLRFGTNAGPLLFVILGLAIVSLPIYRNPTNFEASLPFLAAHRESFIGPKDTPPSHGAPPDVKGWGWDDAAILAVHHHIPVVPLIVRNEWDAKTDPGIAYGGNQKCEESDPHARFFTTCVHRAGAPGAPQFKIMPMGPEDYVAMMEILNWILWPILLTYWIHKAMRE
ncbi:pentapeptide repeat-containing protein [Paraburkholderia solisilvae]|uniref:Membrane-associated oxidoreductase n=1 Tax=Paraburkholderia solisilvae TaxID=624376 RepID=A0A6J5DJL9_9BURK|nr:pentapeptide repeat-containing protein [Paraburkholderia solisilvae]CAB3754143.1 hypothetical protein LMG29739_01905 [Paraburkholderia solisilvae]